MSAGIRIGQGIVIVVRVPIRRLCIKRIGENRVGTDEPVESTVVISGPHVLQSRSRVGLLAAKPGDAMVLHRGLPDLAVGPVVHSADYATVAVGDGSHRARPVRVPPGARSAGLAPDNTRARQL